MEMQALLVTESDSGPVMKRGRHPRPRPGARELLVRIHATALNRADLLQKKGHYPPPEGASPLLGLEMAGTVEECGGEVRRFGPGDRVCGLLAGGGYAEYCVIDEELALPVPELLGFEAAAALPEVFLTSWQALVWLGEINPGESVLIHAGASGIGSAAIPIARKLFDARVCTTAGSQEKLDFCRASGAELAIHRMEEDFADRIIAAFGHDAVDLIVDPVGAPYWERHMRLLAMDGRLVQIALLGGSSAGMNLADLLRKRLTIRGTTLRNRSLDYKRRLTADFRERCLPLVTSGDLAPVIDSVFDWTDVEEAHGRMERNLNIGKIVLTGM